MITGNALAPTITFNEAAHTYTDQHGIQLPSVTTIAKPHPPGPLMDWAARESIRAMLNGIGYTANRNSYALRTKDLNPAHAGPSAWELASTFQNAHEETAQTAADIGTMVHESIFTGLPTDATDAAIAAMQGWEQFNEDYEVQWFANEVQVHAQGEFPYAGTLDLLGTYKGAVILADLKTSSGVYSDMAVQLAGYIAALPFPVQGAWIIRVSKKEPGEYEVAKVNIPDALKAWDAALRFHYAGMGGLWLED